MKFLQHSKMVELRGDYGGGLHLITTQQVQHLIYTNGDNSLFHIHVLSPEPPSTQNQDPHIQILLHKYKSLFKTSTSLPPTRETNHSFYIIPKA